MTAIIDYGVGNLFSIKSSLDYIGLDSEVVSRPEDIGGYDRVILPGVGAFRDAAEKLTLSGMRDAVIKAANEGKPVLGICLGMQLLLAKSYENGRYDGLGLIDGEVRYIGEFIPDKLKIPQIGWNGLNFPSDKPKSPIFKYTDEGDCVYFVHSYSAVNCPDVTAFTDYGAPVAAAVGYKNIFGVQFHPEKSGETGLDILRAFGEV